MAHTLEDRIRERAYHFWVADGMADGAADHHWVLAETALRTETKAAKITAAKVGAAPGSKPCAAGEAGPAPKAKRKTPALSAMKKAPASEARA